MSRPTKRASWVKTASKPSATITILVLKLKIPQVPNLASLVPLWPVFLSYILSFVYIGIYWNKLQYGSHPYYERTI